MSELEEQEAGYGRTSRRFGKRNEGEESIRKRDEREMGEGEDRGEETVTFRRLKEREKGEERV